jgi:hypothetical protein
MVRGFAVGSLVLIAIYVTVQKGASTKVGQASGDVVNVMKRLFSPKVAGIGNHAKKTAGSGGPSSGGSTGVPVSTSGPYFQNV